MATFRRDLGRDSTTNKRKGNTLLTNTATRLSKVMVIKRVNVLNNCKSLVITRPCRASARADTCELRCRLGCHNQSTLQEEALCIGASMYTNVVREPIRGPQNCTCSASPRTAKPHAQRHSHRWRERWTQVPCHLSTCGCVSMSSISRYDDVT